MARKKQKSKQLAGGCLMLFALPFLAVGLGMGGCNAWTVAKHRAARNWVEVPATIQTVELEEHEDDEGGTTYKAVATYSYEVDGRPYTGDRVSLHAGSDNVGRFQRYAYAELKRHQESGQPFHCYVNPDDPQESVLYRRLRWEMLLMFAVFAAVFGSAGVWMSMAAWAQKFRPATTPADLVPKNEPWLARTDWAAGRIPDTDTKIVTPVMSALAVWWLLVSVPIAVALPTILDEPHSQWMWLLLLVPAVGVLLMVVTLYQAVRRRKFGQSVFELANTPGVVGGPLAGVVRIPAVIRPEGGFRIKLSCLRRTEDSDGDTHESAAWTDQQQVSRTLDDGRTGETAVPVLMAIPYDARPSSPPSGETGVRWILELSAAVPGVDYQAEFEVPVFKTADSQPDFRLDPELAADYLAQPEVGPLLAEAGIRREPLGAGSVRLVFRALRNPGSAVGIGLFAAGWTAVVWALFHFEAPIIFPVVFGLFDLFFIWITLDLWFYRSVVEASPRRMFVRGGWLGFGIGRSFPAEAVQRFEIKRSMSSGRHVWNSIKLHLRSGDSYTVAQSIASRAVERAVIDELEMALCGGEAPADRSGTERAAGELPESEVGPLLAEAGVARTPLGTDGVRLVFRMLRHPGDLLRAIAWSIVLLAALGTLIHFQAHIVLQVIVGLIALVFVAATLAMALRRTLIEASPDGLRVRGSWLGIGCTRHWPADSINRFDVEKRMSTEKSHFLHVVLRGGERRTLVRGISSLTAQAVIHELETALGRQKKDNHQSATDTGPQLWMDAPQ